MIYDSEALFTDSLGYPSRTLIGVGFIAAARSMDGIPGGLISNLFRRFLKLCVFLAAVFGFTFLDYLGADMLCSRLWVGAQSSIFVAGSGLKVPLAYGTALV